jgi:hypothetical protein
MLFGSGRYVFKEKIISNPLSIFDINISEEMAIPDSQTFMLLVLLAVKDGK